MWDLQRNGGSMPATMERILAGRGLDAVRRPLFSLSDLLPSPPLSLDFWDTFSLVPRWSCSLFLFWLV